MGRRSSRPSGGRRAAPARAPARSSARAPARSASTQARRPAPQRAASTAPATTKSTPAPPPAKQQAPQKGSAMGGFMANVASTGLGVMAGRAMDRALFGGGSTAPAPEEVPVDGAQPYDASPSSYSAAPQEEISDSVCAREALEFKKCMERTQSDIVSCQWNIDILAACQRQQQDLGFASAGRM